MSDNTITLHFGLKEGDSADLEVVAAACLNWVEAMRIAAQDIDPGTKFRVELIDAQEGSLKLNTIFDWAEKQLTRLEEGAGEYSRLKKLAIAFSVFLIVSGGPTYDFYFGDEPEMQLSQEDRQTLDAILNQLKENPEFEKEKRKFFKELESDRAITEVGVSEGRENPPAILVPREQFPERSGLWALQEEELKRTSSDVLDVTLVSPVLVPAKRSWKFEAEGWGEFNAKMKDEEFLMALEQDHVKERLRTGIKMKIRIKTEEEKVGGVWKIKYGGRSVVKVLSPSVD